MMSLLEKINEDLKTAMKQKDQAALRAIRAIKSGLLLMQTEEGRSEIKENDEVRLLQKMLRQRMESIAIYEKQNRKDLADSEKEEIEIISKYLPAQMTEDDVRKVIEFVIAETGAKSPADIGKVMSGAMVKLSGKSDGKTISAIARELLSKK